MLSTREARDRLGLSPFEFMQEVRLGRIKPESGTGMSAQFSEEEIERYDAEIGDKDPPMGLTFILPEKKNTYYDTHEMAVWMELKYPYSVGKIVRRGDLRPPTGKLAGNIIFYSHRTLQHWYSQWRTQGYTTLDIQSMLRKREDNAKKFMQVWGCEPIGRYRNFYVYDPEEVRKAMSEDEKVDSNLRVQRVDNSVGHKDRGWFIVKVDRENETVKVITDHLKTYQEILDDLQEYNSTF